MFTTGRLRRITGGAVTATMLFAGAVTTAPAAEAVRGDVRVTVTYVVDGDTIHVRMGSKVEKVRVIGVDTPEKRECFAQQATAETKRLVKGKSIRLRGDRTQPNRDRHGRLLRHVVLNDGTKLAQRLISNGFGRELTVGKPYSGQPTYRRAQATAKAKKRGLWKGCRASGVTKPRPASRKPTSNCSIKGNIASDGEKIYHVPGQRYYDVTKIDHAKGERWFCSTEEARRAGWRPAKI